MNTQPWLPPTLTWFGLLIIAFINGALRELGMKKALQLDNQLSHQLSCLTGIFLWTALTLVCWDWLKISSLKNAILVGLAWFIATLIFETFILNRSLSWQEILQTYNVADGEFWGLVLLWIGVMPVVLFLMKYKSFHL